MATKIRLQRGGRKGYAFYRIVIADARAPRDGKFTEKVSRKAHSMRLPLRPSLMLGSKVRTVPTMLFERLV